MSDEPEFRDVPQATVEQIVDLARRHAARPDLSIGAARTLIRGLATKLERLSASPASPSATGVKALEWSKHPDDAEWYSDDDPSGNNLGLYWIAPSKINEGEFELRIAGMRSDHDTFGTVGLAMSAAQSDYEARILSALVEQPESNGSAFADAIGGGFDHR